MKSIFGKVRSLRNQYALFITTVIITIVVTQLIIHYDLSNQNEDAHLINIAGRQRMLSQRIAKRVLYFQQEFKEGEIDSARIDTLQKLIRHWEKVHLSLLNGSDEFGLSNRKSPRIDSLLNVLTPPLNAIVAACNKLIEHPDTITADYTANIISQNELHFLQTMEETVATYQREAEEKLRKIKKVELALALSSILILIMEFIFIFMPIMRTLKLSNHELSELNNELAATNEELQTVEEELRTNLEYLNTLKDEVAEREKQFREVVEHATDMIYELEESGRFSYANPVMESICGYTKRELASKQYWDLVHPDFREQVVQFYLQQRKQKQEITYLEFPILPRNGSEVWVGQNTRMFFKDKWVFKVNVVARDITMLVRAREALQTSEELFRTLTEHAPVGIYQLDKNGTATFINKKWFEIIGLNIEGSTIETRHAAIYKEDKARVTAAWDNAVKNQSGLSLEFRYFTPKKGITWVNNNLHPIKNKENQVYAFIGTLDDITEIKNAQHIMREAKEKAEEATLAKSQFLSMMSHEIRTPMNAIIGLTNLMMQEDPREDQQENLKLLKFSGENLLTIINDILDFSKIEAGKIILEWIPFDLSQLAKNIVQMLEHKAQDKGIQLLFKYDEKLPNVFVGDPVRITQIVTNLVGNAIQFTERGYVELSISLEAKTEEKYALRFSVKDTGIGIDPKKTQNIFESFSQANSDTTRKFGGTGLGLSITKRLLELMESKIIVESSLGKGSTFSFTLNLKEGILRNENQAFGIDYTTEFANKKIKILLVEDNRVNQIVAGNFLRKWGIEVEFAIHGREAVKRIRNKSYHLVLMDLQMPEMDGYEATRIIRNMNDDDYFKTVPIIALTASAMMEIRDKVVGMGMTDFVSKPFIPEELQAKIGKYVFPEKKVKIEITERQSLTGLDLYADGNQAFKQELAGLLIRNIHELQEALQAALQQQQVEEFRMACHKAKPTIQMMGNTEFLALLEELKRIMINPDASISLEDKVESFDRLSKQLINALEEIQSV